MAVKVLFLCVENSVRSQMAEHVLRKLGGDHFQACSAGTQPGKVHPMTIRTLDEMHIDASNARSKCLNEFLDQYFDYIITVCNRARDACPTFPGDSKRIHWGFDDPAAIEGDDELKIQTFRRTGAEIVSRIRSWVAAVDKERNGCV